MADKPSKLAVYWQKRTKRERIILVITLFCVLSILIDQIPYSLLVKSVISTRTGISDAEKELLDQTLQNAELKRRASVDMAASAGWDLADQKSAILFLEDMSGAARRVGVSLVEVHPSQEISKEKYREVSMSLDLKGRYRELGEYFKRLENLPTVVNIRKVRIESCPDSSSVCAAQIEAVTYRTK